MPAPPPARESAIIKNKGPLPPPIDPPHQRKSTLLKHGTYTHTTIEEAAAAAAEAQAQAQAQAQAAMQAPPPAGEVAFEAAEAAPPPPQPTVVPSAPAGPPIDQQLLEEAKRRGEAIVRQAQIDAKKLLEESRIHCQSALQQAERDGFELGRQKGMEASQNEMGAMFGVLRQMLAEFVHGRELALRSSEGEIGRLAMKIAERVTQTMVTTNPEVIKNQVAAALERVKDREHINVRVNPQDIDVVRARKDTFFKLLEGPKTFEISADPKVDRGGVIIETNLGNVDARINTQLQALNLAFVDVEKRQQEEWQRAAIAAQQEVEAQAPPPQQYVDPQQFAPQQYADPQFAPQQYGDPQQFAQPQYVDPQGQVPPDYEPPPQYPPEGAPQ